MFFLLTLVSAYAQKNMIHSMWRNSSISIDGSSSDWPQPLPYYDSKAKVQYCLANDSNYFYICIRASDEMTQMKIIRAGMDIWFDTRGGKKQICAIHYPLPTNSNMDMPKPDAGESMEPEKIDKQKIKLAAMTNQKEMRIQGLLNIPNGFLPLDNLLEIRAAVNWDKSEVLTYELKVPFSVFLKESLSAPDTIKPISIDIVVNGLNLALPPSGMDGSADGGSGAPGMGQGSIGGGPPGGGGMGGGPPGGGMGDSPTGGMSGGPPGGDMGGTPPGMGNMMEMAKSQETWIKLRLAIK